MAFDVDYYIAYAEKKMTSQRFKHSLGVMQVMSELASIYNLNKTAAIISAILHDIAKEFTPDDQIKLANENNIALLTEYDRYPLFLHGPVGACYVAQQLGITDSTILEAIWRHSYFGDGATLSPSFCWCLRFADMLEPSRNWEGLKSQLKPFVYSGKIGEGAYLLVRWIIPFHESASLPIHPNICKLVQELSTLRNEKNLDEINDLPV
jgi:predicted HD superfamily hydrolase involved in NAD metabolism